jgi:hypothetical protein
LDLYPFFHSAGGVKVLEEACDLLSGDVKASLQRAESNLNALNTVDLGPKRPFSVGECALWARLTGPQFATQVAAAVGLVELPSNCGKAAAVAKEFMAIKYSNKTGVSITKFLGAPFAGNTLSSFQKGTEAAAAEAAVTAAEAIAMADFEEAKRLAAEFEALGGGALAVAIAQEAEAEDPLRKCYLAHELIRVSEARSINRAEILTARTDAAAEVAEVAAAEAAAAEAAAAEAAAAAESAAAVEAVAAAEAAAAVEAATAAGGRRESRRRCAWRGSGFIARAAERAWRRRGRHGRGRRGDPRAARGIENSRRVAQQRGSIRGSPGQEINTDQAYEITPAQQCASFMNTASKLGPHTQTDRGTCPGVGL